MEQQKSISFIVTGCAYAVYNEMHYGLMESAYEAALTWELEQKGFHVERQVLLPLYYKGVKLEQTYRIDLLLERRIVIELKTTSQVLPEHRMQLMNYLRLTHLEYGMLINFGPEGVRVERYVFDETHNRVELLTENVIR